MSDERFNAETAALLPLRRRHAEEMIESGLVRRAIESPSSLNLDSSKIPLNEGSDIKPIRKSIRLLNIVELMRLGDAIGYIDSPDNGLLAPELVPLLSSDQPSRQLTLCRSEPSRYRYSSPDVNHYELGVQLGRVAADARSLDRLVPVEGIKVDDLALVVRQMKEIADFATEHDLISVDPATLLQFIGEPYDQDVNPYFPNGTD